MRILKIDLPATITSVDPDISLASDALREQLRRELDALKEELGESVRRRAADYFPPDYTVFVRFFFWIDDNRAKVILWIDDPTVAWPSGLWRGGHGDCQFPSSSTSSKKPSRRELSLFALISMRRKRVSPRSRQRGDGLIQ